MHLDPPGTLLRCGLFALLAGGAWALFAALVVFVGSVRIPPQVAPGRIWRDWRLHRHVWAVALIATAAGLLPTADAVARAVGLRDLYWAGRGGELLVLARFGAATGYLLVLLGFVLAAIRARRRGGGQESAPPARK